MLIEELAAEIKQALAIHKCSHKACDCHKAKELLDILEALAKVRYPWAPEFKMEANHNAYQGKTKS